MHHHFLTVQQLKQWTRFLFNFSHCQQTTRSVTEFSTYRLPLNILSFGSSADQVKPKNIIIKHIIISWIPQAYHKIIVRSLLLCLHMCVNYPSHRCELFWRANVIRLQGCAVHQYTGYAAHNICRPPVCRLNSRKFEQSYSSYFHYSLLSQDASE